RVLSGGERNRVALSRMLVEPANTLLLDEPTNHLDPPSVDVLTDALVEFPGTLVFISHDPVFLARVSTKIVEIEEGQARDYLGDYEYYLWKKSQELESIKGSPKDDAMSTPTAAPRPRAEKAEKGRGGQRRDTAKALARVDRQVARLEEQIAEAEQRIKARDAELADGGVYQERPRCNVLNKERGIWTKEHATPTTQWAARRRDTAPPRARLQQHTRPFPSSSQSPAHSV